jgi:hypothetical protein
MSLLLIGSSHAHWTRSALLRHKIPDFFSSLLVYELPEQRKTAENISIKIIFWYPGQW